MDNVNMYLFEENGETKAVIVAHNITVAMGKLQEWLDEKNLEEEFTQQIVLYNSSTGISDWDCNVIESYKPTNPELQGATGIVASTYQIFELPFAIGKVYGAIGNF